MPTLEKTATPSAKLASKPAAPVTTVTPVTTKRDVSQPLLKKPAAAPAKKAASPATAKPAQVAKPTPASKSAHIAKPSSPASVAKEVKVEKVKKPKLIRDSFTIPKAEYLVIEALKERAGKLSRAAKKSELLRAGIKALAAMSDTAFLSALTAVPTIKTGRPSTAD
jgi:hypothetical protein